MGPHLPSPPETPNRAGGLSRRLWSLLAVPLGVLLLVPLAIVLAVWFYLAAAKEGTAMILRMLFRRAAPPPPSPLPRPHFGEARTEAATDPQQPRP